MPAHTRNAIVALQLVFDVFHPVVSSLLHVAGIACGAVLALPYALYAFRRKTAGPRPTAESALCQPLSRARE